MKISLIELRRDELRFVEACPPEDLGLDGEFFREPVQVSVEAARQPGGWLLALACRTVVHRICDRCTAELDVPLAVEEQVLLLEEEHATGLDEEDEVLVLHADMEEIGLEQPIRDALVTALPDRFFCREDCLGLCDQCGQDLNEGDCACETPVHESPLAGLARFKRDGEAN